MKIKLKNPFSLNGQRLEAGEHELPDHIAQALIERGVAVEVKPPKKNRGGK
ncbi:hypothetical protein [Nitratifractor salsuginis]|uniref:Uncharacterized protein n=1 Tax=Nitratifractor salsuginis (strain DSM 16511 / JCM 12458 / E9I37-1) TaxID=749222 RepID=E6X1M9_NITSE|nr:hypothetical protein [Nitratifractor salsuginis]ADV47020.1 hypothetical protein Nitsa_1775 [Nitratifractor salsuginis DSM 16511]